MTYANVWFLSPIIIVRQYARCNLKISATDGMYNYWVIMYDYKSLIINKYHVNVQFIRTQYGIY